MGRSQGVGTHPKLAAGPIIRWPKRWVPCPLCGKHYVTKGKAHRGLCLMVTED